MTEAFSLEEVETIKTVEVKEYHKSNATCEALRYSIENDIEIPEGTIYGVVVAESILDNEIPYYVIPKMEDEEGNAIPKNKFNEVYRFDKVKDGLAYMWASEVNTFRGEITGANITRAIPKDELNGIVKYMKSNFPTAEFHTISAFQELLESLKEPVPEDVIS